MASVTVNIPAKINLTLDVVGRRGDGYHLLKSIMQTVDLQDQLTVSKIPAGVMLDTQGAVTCPIEHNVVTKAARCFFEKTGVPGGAVFRLVKRIPQQAGMGGGSADAAATIAALNRLYETNLTLTQQAAIGLQVGADVPFCFVGGTALVTGIGEVVRPLPPLPDCRIVVAKPAQSVSTAEAYAILDEKKPSMHPDTDAAIKALLEQDLTSFCWQMKNVFEESIGLPAVASIRKEMERFSPLASQMTGSGSAVFGIFTDGIAAEACARSLRSSVPEVFVCSPCGPFTLAE